MQSAAWGPLLTALPSQRLLPPARSPAGSRVHAPASRAVATETDDGRAGARRAEAPRAYLPGSEAAVRRRRVSVARFRPASRRGATARFRSPGWGENVGIPCSEPARPPAGAFLWPSERIRTSPPLPPEGPPPGRPVLSAPLLRLSEKAAVELPGGRGKVARHVERVSGGLAGHSHSVGVSERKCLVLLLFFSFLFTRAPLPFYILAKKHTPGNSVSACGPEISYT